MQLESAENAMNLPLSTGEVDSFREVLRQQLLGDQELLRDCVAGREDPEIRLQVYDRIRLVQRLGEHVGLGTVVERRRRSRASSDEYVQIPIRPALVTAVVLSTVAVYAAWWFGLGSFSVLYVPVVLYATLRHGKRSGTVTAIGCSLAYISLAPTEPHHVIRGAICLGAMLLAIWLVRRDVV